MLIRENSHETLCAAILLLDRKFMFIDLFTFDYTRDTWNTEHQKQFIQKGHERCKAANAR